MAEETIFALSSGPPPAGVAVIRVSGGGSRFALETLVDSVPEPRRAVLRSIGDADGAPIDRGLVMFFPAPASFTGEDMAELHVHGGRAVIAAVLHRLGGLPGFRPAEAGEFTRRAFLNARFDLTEVEGLGDLIRAETEAQRRQALRQASGALRRIYDDWRERLVRARALVEAELDFADEDDVPGSVAGRAWPDVGAVLADIRRHLDDKHRGERLREGAEIVVLGPVNSGKSSLINALARRDAAIVSPEPGTTRDLIEVRLDVAGYPMTVVDTAGLRDAPSAVEAEGIRRAGSRAGGADLVVWLQDVTAATVAPPGLPGSAPLVRVGTKLDLIDSDAERSRLSGAFDVVLSSKTDYGIDVLIDRLARFARDELEPGESPLVTRERQRSALSASADALERAMSPELQLELRAEELRRATDALGRVTGRVDVEDLLDVIFRDFCIGK